MMTTYILIVTGQMMLTAIFQDTKVCEDAAQWVNKGVAAYEPRARCFPSRSNGATPSGE